MWAVSVLHSISVLFGLSFPTTLSHPGYVCCLVLLTQGWQRLDTYFSFFSTFQSTQYEHAATRKQHFARLFWRESRKQIMRTFNLFFARNTVCGQSVFYNLFLWLFRLSFPTTLSHSGCVCIALFIDPRQRRNYIISHKFFFSQHFHFYLARGRKKKEGSISSQSDGYRDVGDVST